MRARVAKSCNTHALDPTITSLSLSQLSLLYKQTMQEEKEESEEKYSLIKELNNFWAKNFGTLFENLEFFVNPKMYQRLEELKELEVYREEVKPEDFEEEWDKMMEILPDAYEVQDVESRNPLDDLPEMDLEEDILAGWVSKEEGGD